MAIHTMLHAHAKKAFSGKKHLVTKSLKVSFWFFLGVFLGFFFFASFLYIFYKNTYTNLVYEGVMVDGIDFGGKTEDEVREYFSQKNDTIHKTQIHLNAEEGKIKTSAKQLHFGYEEDLLSQQAFSVGRSSGNSISDMSLMLQAYVQGINLPPAYHYNEGKLDILLAPVRKKIDIKPVDPLFTFQNGKVIAFQLSKDGRALDSEKLKKELSDHLLAATISTTPQTITLAIPTKVVKPERGDKTNDLGITELIAEGTSLFRGSIENRAYNINLAAARLNGVLIPPGETFSFTKTLGDISAFTGYKQAYVIENGKTVLGDGGGICQVSTTLFRAALNAGLPIVERNPHAYRVGYYEQDAGPGVDAAVYFPSVDMKFKNDTGNHILIQSQVNSANAQITFQLYGTKDDREVIVGKPVIQSESPAPEAVYQDDPNLPKGEVKQVDFAAPGANVYFTRTVKKDGKTLSDKFASNYRPWQAIYMRGTKE